MALRLSRQKETLARFRAAITNGDWDQAESLAAPFPIPSGPISPANEEEFREYMVDLRKSLILAKTLRADATASLARVNAALRFCRLAG